MLKFLQLALAVLGMVTDSKCWRKKISGGSNQTCSRQLLCVMLFLSWSTDYINLKIWGIKKIQKNYTTISKLVGGNTFHKAVKLRLWDYSNHVCNGLASSCALGGLRRVLASPGHSPTAGCLHIWQYLLLLSCLWQGREEGMGTGTWPGLFSWPEIQRGNGFPSSQPSAPAESCTETASFAGLFQLCNTVVDIRDSFRHYCYQCYIASISTSKTSLNHCSFKNQSYSEREKTPKKNS